MTKINRALILHLFGVPLLGAGLVVMARWFPIVEQIATIHAFLAKTPLLGAMLHPLLFALCNVLLLPGGILAIGAGLFFGVWTGWMLNLVGSVLSAWAAMVIARHLARNFIERKFLSKPRWAVLDAAIARDGPRIIFLTQLHPLAPTSLLNYLYGVTGIRIGPALLWIAAGQAPGLLLYAYLGSVSRKGIEAAGNWATIPASQWAAWTTIIVLSGVILALLSRASVSILSQSGVVEPED